VNFQAVADRAAKWAGSRWAFILAACSIIGWGAVGPIFGFSDSWSLFINTLTTIVTFLMVFLIQNSQNRGNAALHAKLDELIRVNEAARNDLVGLEAKTEEDIAAAAESVKEAVEENNGSARLASR
jgi:low affinity Fe/Cu permease